MNVRVMAASLPLIPGQTVQVPVDVMLEFMRIWDLEFIGKPYGGYGVVRPRWKEVDMPGLTGTLEALLERSAKRKEPARMRLKGGLEIAVLDQGDKILIQLSRNDIYPSFQEWKTVIKYLPVKVKPDEPKSFLHDGKFFLRGTVEKIGE